MTNFIDEKIQQCKKEVDIEGCQAEHEGEKCLHCGISPCPHCKLWGGKQRTSVVFSIAENTFIQILDEAIQEEREKLSNLKSEVEKIKLPVPNPYGKWVKVENVNKILQQVINLIEKHQNEG